MRTNLGERIIFVSDGAAKLLRRRTVDAAQSLSHKIVGDLQTLSDSDLKCLAADRTSLGVGDAAIAARREQAALVLFNRKNKQFWRSH